MDIQGSPAQKTVSAKRIIIGVVAVLVVGALAFAAHYFFFSPRVADTLLLDAQMMERRGDRAGAEEAYRRALAKNKNLSQAHAGYARLLLAKQDLEGAKKESVSASALASTDREKAEAATTAGLIFFAEDKPDEAKVSFEEATRLDGGYAKGWHALGLVLATQFLPEASLEALTKAETLDPATYSIHILIAQQLLALGREEDAEAAYARARIVIQSDPMYTQEQKEVLLSGIHQVSSYPRESE